MLEDINKFEDSYQVLKSKKTSKIINFTTILLILILLFIVYFIFYPLKNVKEYYGTIYNEKGVSYVVFKTNYIDEFIYNKNLRTILKINDKEVNYEIVDIINNINYYDVILKLQLNYEPRLIKLLFILKEKTLYEKMKEALIYGKNF